MNYTLLNFLTLLGAVGLFLYGMKVMSEGLQKVAGDKMRGILSAMTKNRFAGVFTGIQYRYHFHSVDYLNFWF